MSAARSSTWQVYTVIGALFFGSTVTGRTVNVSGMPRKVPQIAFKPDWTKHAKAAPFKRNDQMLATLPIGVIVFPGTGIQDNLADKARKMGIPVIRIGAGSA